MIAEIGSKNMEGETERKKWKKLESSVNILMIERCG